MQRFPQPLRWGCTGLAEADSLDLTSLVSAMAIPRNNRERQGPSSTLIIVGSVLVGVLLVAVWVMSSPAAIPEDPGTTVSNMQETLNPGVSVVDADTQKEFPVVQDDTPAVEDETQAVEEDTPAVEEETPAVEEDSPAEVEETPAVKDDAPAVEDLDAEPGHDLGTTAELTTETQEQNSTLFETQVQESANPKPSVVTPELTVVPDEVGEWKLCSFAGAQDYIPCLDNTEAIKKLPTTSHYEHRERHCPSEEDVPKCLLPLPANYKVPIKWPASRDAVLLHALPFFLFS